MELPSYQTVELRDERGVKYIPKDAGFEYLERFAFHPILRYIRSHDLEEQKQISKYFNNRNYAQIYTMVFNLSTQKGDYRCVSELYEFQKIFMNGWMENLSTEIIQISSDEDFVHEYEFVWKQHNQVLKAWWQKFFIYLDFSYIPSRKDLEIQKIDDQLDNQFHLHIYEKVKDRLITICIQKLNMERNGESVSSIHELVRFFSDFTLEWVGTKNSKSMYHTDFEPILWKSSTEYYLQKADEWKHSLTNMEYISRVLEFQSHEEVIQNKYLISSSKMNLKKSLIESFMVQYKMEILSHTTEGLEALLERKDYVNLNRIFDFLSQIPNEEGLIQFAKSFKEYLVHHIGMMIQTTLESTEMKTLTQNLCMQFLDKMSEMDRIVTHQMKNHILLRKAFTESMIQIVNRQYMKGEISIHLTQQFADFFDDMAKKMNSEEARPLSDLLIQVVSYMTDKDLFLEYSRINMAKRILQKKNKDQDVEIYFISLLKPLLGTYSTTRLEGMIRDKEKTTEEIQDYLDSPKPFRTLFEPTNITFGNWPQLSNTPLHLPATIRECYQHYEEYYRTRRSGYKVDPIYSYGTAVVNAQYPTRSYDFVMNIPQTTVYYLFMGHLNTMTYQQIREETQMSDSFLKRVLHSLSCNRSLRILHKSPESNSIQETDSFRFNVDFHSPNRVIQVPCAVFEESNVAKKVSEDRTYEIQASIIRIMKSRQKMKHQDLVMETTKQLSIRFQPTIESIKKNIGVLIEKEYLERDMNDHSTYKYLA